MRKIYLLIVILGVSAASIFFILDLVKHPRHSKTQGIQAVQTAPQLGGPFRLTDHNGIVHTQADFKGKFMIVYFGYSYCPDICPTALYNISEALEKLTPAQRELFQPLFVTIDPERDTVKRLNRYMENFDPSFLALTGSHKEIDAVMKSYKVYGKKVQAEGTSLDYLVDHSSIVYVMDKAGQYVTSFNHQTNPQEIITVLRRLLEGVTLLVYGGTHTP
jgi:cytochrome oxidase Cu insertion factor (SCO1/SenC/PrrC family)